MPISGSLLFETSDDYGPLRVFDDGNRRILAFGEETEQSSIWIFEPARLLYPYTQAMMLGLLFAPAGPRVTVLGIGGGSILHALLQHLPRCQIDAVELREKVVEIAQSWFSLPDDPRLTIHVADALDYLARNDRPSHLIFTDLFHEGGMETRQTEAVFLRLCHDALAPEGVLVINLWDVNQEETREHRRVMEETFGKNVLLMSAPGGNHVAFCFKGKIPRVKRKEFLADAQKLGLRMKIPLQDHANRLLQGNKARL